ncbi:hypothetical protein [Brachybacterium huguangmaarense]
MTFTHTSATPTTVPLTLTFWSAVNTTGQLALSAVTPYSTSSTSIPGNDKITVRFVTDTC